MEYTVLIAEDNPIVLESLLCSIPWDQLGLRVIATAENGYQGCERIRQYHPDIVLADIHMPEMDGLAMMEAVQEELSESRVIFITAHTKIVYASRAIRLSAFDFILKPLDNEELYKSLSRAVESLDKDRDATRESERRAEALRRFRLMNALTSVTPQKVEDVFLSFTNKIPKGYFLISAESTNGISGPTLQRLKFMDTLENVEICSVVLNGDLVLYCGLLKDTTNWHAIARSLAAFLTQDLLEMSVAVSELHTDISELRVAYEEVRQTLLQHMIYGNHNNVAFYGSPSMSTVKRTRLADLEQECSKLALQIDNLTAEQVWEVVMEKSGGKLRIVQMMLMFFCTRTMQDKIKTSRWSDSADVTVYGITKLESLESARLWLDHFFAELQKIHLPDKSQLVNRVLEYIKEYVTDGLGLENVASIFYVSPNYLSTLIRKETGITYRQHVINAKIAVAKQMLDDTRMRVEDIAYAIGYENYISFYNVFKKIVGMSPTEYRFNKRDES